jgi:two-component system nitrate/nitrite response regulator NarL
LPPIRIAIVDDHQIVIEGLSLLLNTYPQFTIVAEATSGFDMLQQLHTALPDILITDIMMPDINGFKLAMTVRKDYPGIKIIALSMSEEGSLIARMIDEAKVEGYLPKAAGKTELIETIQKVYAGKSYYSASITSQYATYKSQQTDNQLFNLTARELQIIECIMRHFTNRQIANQLFISERTVETHRKNIYRKTNTKGEASLVQFVKEHKFL